MNRDLRKDAEYNFKRNFSSQRIIPFLNELWKMQENIVIMVFKKHVSNGNEKKQQKSIIRTKQK